MDDEGIPDPVRHIARDPFDPRYDAEAVVAALRARRSAVKQALLDQTLVSGIGNIYADEALWRAGVHGERVAATLSRPTMRRILGHAHEVMAGPWTRAGRASTRSMSMSTARPATSTGR